MIDYAWIPRFSRRDLSLPPGQKLSSRARDGRRVLAGACELLLRCGTAIGRVIRSSPGSSAMAGPLLVAGIESAGLRGFSGGHRHPRPPSAPCHQRHIRFRPFGHHRPRQRQNGKPPGARVPRSPRPLAVNRCPPAGAAGEAIPAVASFQYSARPAEGTTFALVAAGGTGGHVFPGIAAAQALLQEAEFSDAGAQHRWGEQGGTPGAEAVGQGQRGSQGLGPSVDSVVQFAGSRERLEWTAVPAAGFRLHSLPAPRLLRRPHWRMALSLLTLPWRMAWACLAALGLLLRLRPRVVLGTGGYVALPACLAAVLLRIPLVLQEQNAFPGRTNLLLSRLATAVCVGFPAAIAHFPASARDKCIVTGNPVRKDLLFSRTASATVSGVSTTLGAGPSMSKTGGDARASALRYFYPAGASAASDASGALLAATPDPASGMPSKVDIAPGADQILDMVPRLQQVPSPLVLLVMGGSLGASPLNAALSAVALQLLAAHPHLHIIWQTGDKDGQQAMTRSVWKGLDKQPRLVIQPFIQRMDLAYAAADIAVCRAGAVTCSELLATGTPSVLIPSPYVADDHQQRNAEAIAEQDAAVILAERDLSAETLLQTLAPLLGDETVRAKMRRNAWAAARPTAAAEIAKLMWAVGHYGSADS